MFDITLICMGKLKEKFYTAAAAEYEKRLKGYCQFKILELLARNKKKIFSLEHIYQAIWEDNAVGNDAIMVHIKNIRKKLGDSSRNPAYIKTAWGKGYYID